MHIYIQTYVHSYLYTMIDKQAGLHRFQPGFPSGLAWSLYKCAVLWRAFFGPATERPLGTIRGESEFISVSGFLSRCNMTYTRLLQAI